MDSAAFKTLDGIQFYSCCGTSFWCKCLYSNIYDKKYISIEKTSTSSKKGETKEFKTYVNLTIPAAEALRSILKQAIENAKHIEGVQYSSKYCLY